MWPPSVQRRGSFVGSVSRNCILNLPDVGPVLDGRGFKQKEKVGVVGKSPVEVKNNCSSLNFGPWSSAMCAGGAGCGGIPGKCD